MGRDLSVRFPLSEALRGRWHFGDLREYTRTSVARDVESADALILLPNPRPPAMSAPADASSPHTVTELIQRANDGDQVALNDLFARLYGELHTLARSRIRRNTRTAQLDTTSLLHESYLRLIERGELKVENRAHFLAYAARTMRSIIVDFARRRQASRRGGDALLVQLDTEFMQAIPAGEDEVVRVHDALQELEKVDERLVRVVEMRYYGGLTEQEIAQALGVNERTVRRHWEKARLLLSVALK